MAAVLSGASVNKHFPRHRGQTECVIEFAIGQRPASEVTTGQWERGGEPSRRSPLVRLRIGRATPACLPFGRGYDRRSRYVIDVNGASERCQRSPERVLDLPCVYFYYSRARESLAR